MDISIRTFKSSDEEAVVDLWQRCDLLRAWNNPSQDIQRKIENSPELFFVAESEGPIIGSCMAGYDGHRGSIYYLAVCPDQQGSGVGKKLMRHSENALKKLGCPKINLMIRKTNLKVIDFYHAIDYADDPTVVMGRRLIEDKPF